MNSEIMDTSMEIDMDPTPTPMHVEEVITLPTQFSTKFENDFTENIIMEDVSDVNLSFNPKQSFKFEIIEDKTINIIQIEKSSESKEKNAEDSYNPSADCKSSTDVLTTSDKIEEEKSDDSYSNKFVEFARFTLQNTEDKQLYPRGCLISPDGTCILTAINLYGMHVIEIPSYNSEKSEVDLLKTAVYVKETGTVYDYCWYPYMNSIFPESCCWLSSRKDEPIQMWDAYSGELRCSYRGYNAVDEIEAAISVSFSWDGTQIYGGYKKSIKVFDVEKPGREYNEISIKHSCSCFAVHSKHDQIVATGSWKRMINLYDLRCPKLGTLATLKKHIGGLTFLKFSDSYGLFSGARKDNQLILWDMRALKDPLYIFERNIETNQRIYFDLHPNEEWLISGDTDGSLHWWNLKSGIEDKFELHFDCCNGVSFHPSDLIISTSSGKYHLLSNEEFEEDVSDHIEMYENVISVWSIQSCKTLAQEK